MSDTSRASAGRKRRADNITSDDATPKPKPNPQPKLLFPKLPARPKSRSNSPIKSRGVLKLLEKPIHVTSLETSIKLLPNNIQSLYSSLYLASCKEGVVPLEVRGQVLSLVGELRARPYCFHKEPTPGAAEIHTTLCEIRLEADAAASDQYHETGWNHCVHTPLLKSVFASRRQNQTTQAEARMVSVMSATIVGDYIPFKLVNKPVNPLAHLHVTSATLHETDVNSTDVNSTDVDSTGGDCTDVESLACSVSVDAYSGTGIQSEQLVVHSRSDSKKVDYVLVLDAASNTPLMRVLSFYLHNDGVERRLLPHVNQTMYQALQWSPIACSVETKLDISGGDPMLQLGIWVAAWHKRMHLLRNYLLAEEPSLWHEDLLNDRMPSTLLIEVVNHTWQLYFACDRGDSISLHGPLSIGSTASLIDSYALWTSLVAIKQWIQSTFYQGMEKWLLCSRIKELMKGEV
ncbi:hypothetical protein F4802DRAFT_139927 [Xylaria palmicola]|nr:hypothetical protein F4802DRAFT_139927 [Xylaria palmicola]